MAEPQGHHYDDHRMGRWGSDNHGWRMSDGGPRSNGNKWIPEHGCVPMCNSMTCTVRSFASGANSWDSFGGRFELNGAAAAKQYTSRIRLSQCHKAFSLLDEMLSQRLMPDGITYNAAISACENGPTDDKLASVA